MKKQFKQNNNNNAICYYRYSSHAQNEQSIDQQRELARKYADQHGYVIVKEYVDAAQSGRDETRSQYQLMLSEVKIIKPAALIIYKTDRLARDRYELCIAKHEIRKAGCAIECVAEPNLNPDDPTSIFIEGMLDAQAEYYSANLQQNVLRGLNFNAENCYYNGQKILGYTTEEIMVRAGGNKRKQVYVIDPVTSPVVVRIFNNYADGKPLKQIADELNAQGLRTSRDNLFNINGLRHILKNRMYIGEYSYNGIVVPGGVPRIISDELFDAVRRRFELNKHKSKPVLVEGDTRPEPRFWLTGKLFCGECKESMHGISGTSKTGRIHYYYACKNHRRHKCRLRNCPKDLIENCVVEVLRAFLQDTENLASLAVDVSDYARKTYSDDSYLLSLQAELKKTDQELNNVVNAIKQGLFSKIIQNTLSELEIKKEALEEAVETEKVKLALAFDDHSIKRYFEMYAHADFEDEETRNRIFEYFIDKIYVFDDKLIIDMFYSDDHAEVSLDAFLASQKYAEESVRLESRLVH